MQLWNRRQFLRLSASSAGVIFLAQWKSEAFSSHQISSPVSLKSKDGLLEAELFARYEKINLAGRQAHVFSYNGQIPGPTLEVRPGDTVRLRLTNNLPQPTNLHYHGLHIPPTDNADNIFLSIPSGESFNYEFTIPNDRPGGIFFYHPHLHGWVAGQVFGGLGGSFVIYLYFFPACDTRRHDVTSDTRFKKVGFRITVFFSIREFF